MIFALLNRQKSRGVRSQTRVRDDKAKRRGAAKAQNPSIYKTIAVLLFFHTPQYSHHKKIPATHSPPSPPTHQCTANRSLLQEYLGVWWFLWPPMSGYLWKKLNTSKLHAHSFRAAQYLYLRLAMSPYRPTFRSRLTCWPAHSPVSLYVMETNIQN